LKRLTQGNTRILTTIMPNPKGHEDSIKDSRFKAAWQSGPTRTIRVPIALAEVTLEYARQLDQGIEPRDTVQSSDDETSSDDSEPRDTVQSSDDETSSDDSEPRDTREKASSQADNSIKPLPTEPRDTGKMQAELEDARADYAKLLESSTHITNKLKEEVQKLRSQLEQERASREEIEAEFADLKQKSVTASELPEAADLLNQLKGKRKKSKTDLADVAAILEILEGA
jgi:stringent starvation protein B